MSKERKAETTRLWKLKNRDRVNAYAKNYYRTYRDGPDGLLEENKARQKAKKYWQIKK